MSEAPGYKAQAEDTITLTGASSLPQGGRAALLRKHWHKLVALAFWLALPLLYAWYTHTNNLPWVVGICHLIDLLQAPYYGAAIYILAFALRPLVFFSAAALTVIAGSVFGPLWGFALTVVACNMSAAVVYGCGHFFGNGVLERERLRGMVRHYADRLHRNSFETVLLMNLVFLPFDFINYLSGFMRLKFWPFLLATILGSLPGIVACVLLGSSVQIDMRDGLILPDVHPGAFVVSLVLFAIGIGVSRVLRRREARRAEV
jgi:uncharacterized membrane protein YdjX (TVP38/TMEM64 family)